MNTTILKILAVVLGVALVAGIIAYIVMTPEEEPMPPTPTEPAPEQPFIASSTIGSSVQGRDISVYSLGDGEERLLFVGGVHGGYEWNSILLAYEMIDHLTAHPELVPNNLTIDIIPNLNPDGTYEVVGQEGRFSIADVPNPNERVAAGRFNANGVDLNRNFDCKWAPESTWRGETVSAGDAPFSEPEAQALRDFVNSANPRAVAFWHSQANNVYASECENGVLPETLTLMHTYADAAGYGKVPVFDAYPITGDAEGWLASLGIPAITVELENYDSIEWNRNLAGTLSTIKLYAAENLAR